MTNFLLGLVAGSLIACIATIAAARHPDIQARLGLVPVAQAALAEPPSRKEPKCPASAAAANGAVQAAPAQTDALFERRRFWYVSP